MRIKKCIGCLKEVEDKINSPGIATICEKCSFPLESIPKGISREFPCPSCRGKTNLIGAFFFDDKIVPGDSKGIVFLYFDCPNPACAKRRMSIIGTPVKIAKI